MLDSINNVKILTIEILDPEVITGAEFFNYFFTLVIVFGLVAFCLQILFRVVSRS